MAAMKLKGLIDLVSDSYDQPRLQLMYKQNECSQRDPSFNDMWGSFFRLALPAAICLGK